MTIFSKKQKKETRLLSQTIHKTNSKWIKDLNIMPETIKLLEESVRGNSLTLILAISFWICHFRKGKKNKNKQMGPYKFKICTAKETINKGKTNA